MPVARRAGQYSEGSSVSNGRIPIGRRPDAISHEIAEH
jgi:hypothetical protein